MGRTLLFVLVQVDQLRAENAALRDRPSTSTAHVPEVAEATQLVRELSARNRELEAHVRALEKENAVSEDCAPFMATGVSQFLHPCRQREVHADLGCW